MKRQETKKDVNAQKLNCIVEKCRQKLRKQGVHTWTLALDFAEALRHSKQTRINIIRPDQAICLGTITETYNIVGFGTG